MKTLNELCDVKDDVSDDGDNKSKDEDNKSKDGKDSKEGKDGNGKDKNGESPDDKSWVWYIVVPVAAVAIVGGGIAIFLFVGKSSQKASTSP